MPEILSMTGYGRGEAALPDGRGAVIELRAVNHRFLDLACRLPREFLPWEEELRRRIAAAVQRGRVELHLAVSKGASAKKRVLVDTDLAQAYDSALKDLAKVLNVPGTVPIDRLLRLPEVLSLEEEPVEGGGSEVGEALARACGEALEGLLAMRRREGRSLAGALEADLGVLEGIEAEVSKRAPAVVEGLAARLRERLAELLGGVPVDEGRLLNEVALLAERCDIAEELARVASHRAQFRLLLAQGGAVGRSLDFLTQELHREWNTIGSKAGDAAVARWVVQAKAVIERLREQVQNVE